MKTIPTIVLFTCLLGFATNRCFAMMDIEEVTVQRAKELGLEVRFSAAGPKAVRVELELELKGELTSLRRVDLEIRDGERWLQAALQEDRSKPGHVVVSFAVDRVDLNKIALRVVTGEMRNLVGHELLMKDFVDPTKLR